MPEKPLYKLTIDLVTYVPDALQNTLNRIRELTDEYDQTSGEIKTKVVVETDSEEAVRAIRYQLETYLRHNKMLISGDVTVKEPLVRPDPTKTPMERYLDRMVGDRAESVTLSSGGKSATLTAETARNASEMLQSGT